MAEQYQYRHGVYDRDQFVDWTQWQDLHLTRADGNISILVMGRPELEIRLKPSRTDTEIVRELRHFFVVHGHDGDRFTPDGLDAVQRILRGDF